MKKQLVLAINPGSTSTKAAVFEGDKIVAEASIRHNGDELAACGGIEKQKDLRAGYISGFLEHSGLKLENMSAIIGRGGILKPVPSGIYKVNEAMLKDLEKPEAKRHASMLGAVIAKELADRAGINAYIADPVVVDEMWDVARFSGLPAIKRGSVFHALNQKAMARKQAAKMGGEYEDYNFIVAHLGGGITVGAHLKGKVVDLNNGITGEGPFSPERCGSLPLADVISMCYSGEYAEKEIMSFLSGTGGAAAYLGSSDMLLAENKAAENPGGLEAKVLEAMAYQISKEIGALAAAMKGDVDAIILTGSLARCRPVVDFIEESCSWISDIAVFPGENELAALAERALRVLNGLEEAKEYN